MKLFKIIETQEVTILRTWEYEVEAENEEIALDKVMDGDVEAIEFNEETIDQDEFQYEVSEVEGAE